MQKIRHRALHILNGNDLPVTQLLTTTQINQTTLIEECRNDIYEVLQFWEKEGREAYNPKVFK